MNSDVWKILIVDDNSEDRAEIRRLLLSGSDRRYVFTEAETAAAGLRLCEGVTCIVLDYRLPDMDAPEVLAEMRQGREMTRCPVVVLTGTAAREMASGVLRAGAMDYLGKGWMNPESLTRAVENAVERFALQHELQQKEKRLRLAMDTANVYSWEVDVASGQCSWSENAARVLGFPPEAMPRTVAQALTFNHAEDAAWVRSGLKKVISGAHHGFSFEQRLLHPVDQSIVWIEAQGTTENIVNGKPTRIVGLSQNITARKQAEAEREQLLAREQRARELAEAANRAKDDWVAMVTHELRSPLNPMLGHARLLNMRRARLEPELLKFTDLVLRNGERQNELINDLLDTARMTTGKLRLEPGPVHLAGIIADTLETVRASAQAKGVTLLPQLADAGALTGDAARLQQVVWNLLSNAIKFTPGGGSVAVLLRSEPKQIALTVCDTGAGIAPEFLPCVFERFSQADTSRSRRYGGLGLGLALVKQIVELHGGTISASSDGVGCGATFTVRLPVRADESYGRPGSKGGDGTAAEESLKPNSSINPLTPIESKLAGVSILLIEDDADARDLVTALLREQDAAVLTAATAAEAWPLLTNTTTGKTRPRILICDIGLPEEDGYGLLTRLRQWERAHAQAKLPALALTSLNGLPDRLLALQSGFQMHVAKPVNPSELLLVLKTLLERTHPADAAFTESSRERIPTQSFQENVLE